MLKKTSDNPQSLSSITYLQVCELTEKEKVLYILEQFAESGTQINSDVARKHIADQIMRALKMAKEYNPYLGV